MSALGIVRPDPLSAFVEALFGQAPTPIDQFESEHGIQGQSWVEGRELNLLTVLASNPGTGQFRRFIDDCKTEYDCIGVWLVMNRELGSALRRYGFKRATKTHNGERIHGYRWKRGHSAEHEGSK